MGIFLKLKVQPSRGEGWHQTHASYVQCNWKIISIDSFNALVKSVRRRDVVQRKRVVCVCVHVRENRERERERELRTRSCISEKNRIHPKVTKLQRVGLNTN